MPASGGNLEQLLASSENLLDLCPIVNAELECGEVKMLDVVLALGPWLKDTDKGKRLEGMKLLTEVLRLLPASYLTSSEVSLLITFSCERLADHYTIVPQALSALSALTSMDELGDEDPMEIVRVLRENVTCQALTVPSRRHFYSIFHNIYTKKKKKLLSAFGSDFLFGLLSGMDSESDPRNLVYLFSFLPAILADIPLRHLAEETFTLLECYFPVDFNPVEEKDNITREDLARGLEACLAASAELGDPCIVMVCDKLTSHLKVAQMDSLSLLCSGLNIWPLESVSNHIQPLWQSLKEVIIPPTESELSTQGACALTQLLVAFSRGVLGDSETKAFNYLMDSILSSTHGYMSDPSLSLFTPTLRLLSKVCDISNLTCSIVIKVVLPQLSALLGSSRSSADKDTVLKTLKPFVDTFVNKNYLEDNDLLGSEYDWKKIFVGIIPQILSLVEDPLCRGSALDCLVPIPFEISYQQREDLYKFLTIKVADESSTVNREAIGRFISAMSKVYPEEVEKLLLSLTDISIPAESEGIRIERMLELLAWPVGSSGLTPRATEQLLSFITRPPKPIFKHHCLLLLLDYTSKWSEEVLRILGRKCDFPITVINSFLGQDSSPMDGDLTAAAGIITNIVRTLEPSEQTSILQSALQLLVPTMKDGANPNFELVLLEGLVAGLQPPVIDDISLELLTSLIHHSISLDLEEPRTSAARTISLIINKSKNEGVVDTTLEMGYRETKKRNTRGSICLCAWITKALVFRGHPSAGKWINQLLEYACDPIVGMEGAEGVRLLFEENNLLSPANYCTVGLLYKQRVFEKIDLLISDGRKSMKSGSLALAYILKNSPPALIFGRLDKLKDVMLDCVGDGDPVVSTAILQTISTVLKSSVPNIGPLAYPFIPKCLNLAISSPYMPVRQEALECIYLFADFKPEDMMPYKKKVLSELQKCLNDKKRLVRLAAVKARTRWFVL